jgi:hypothetical protein
MDSLPYMTRKSLEPRDKSLIAVALEGGAKRASTPLGLSSGAPPPAASSSALQIGARGVRRGSVDSASGYYSSSTVPAPTITQEKMYEINKGTKTGNHHQFVKSSFAKRKQDLILMLGLFPYCFYYNYDTNTLFSNSRRMQTMP